jgi:hypothetical protein
MQKGADKTIKDNKGRTPYDLAVSKNKLSIVEMLKDQANCEICFIKPNIRKTDKSRKNIFLFIFLHLFLELVVFCMLLPGKK